MIRKNTIVTLRYTMKNGHGEMLENSAISYLHGSPSISQTLQSQLEGLKPGDTKQAFLKKGQEGADDDFTWDIIVESIREATPEEQVHGVPLTKIKIHLLCGFLGSGKTTAIRQACKLLVKEQLPVAVITNDQGSRLVDGDLFGRLGIPSGQVTNGCFCCNYNDLDAAIRHLTKNSHDLPVTVFAESVGSCTDLVATVLKPLLQQHPEWEPSFSVFAEARLLRDLLEGNNENFDETVRYIYFKQLEEARVIVVTKTDLMDTTRLKTHMRTHYKDKVILYQNSLDNGDIIRWMQTLNKTSFTGLPSLDIDYDRYGAGEAKLAWFDQELEIQSPGKKAQETAIDIIENITKIDYPIGHLKFLLDGNTKISITATGATDSFLPQPAPTATLLINARVQTDPETLSRLIATSIKTAAQKYHSTIRTISEQSFQPGYPKPTHRIS